MRTLRLFSIAIFLSFFTGFMEWGTRSEFVGPMEIQVLLGNVGNWDTFIHPLILAPAIGQLLLLYSAVRPNPNRTMVLIGSTLISWLVIMIFATGIVSQNIRMIVSTLPYLITFGAYIWYLKKY